MCNIAEWRGTRRTALLSVASADVQRTQGLTPHCCAQSAAYSDVVDVVTVINSGSGSAAVTLMSAVQAAVSDGSIEVCAPSAAASAATTGQGLIGISPM